jgi:hypothetical protein
MQKPVVLVTNRIFPETEALLAAHARVIVNRADEPWSPEEVQARCREADAVLAFMTDQVDAAFFAGCPRLKVVGAALKGYDNIDVAAAERAGVWVTIVPDLLTVPTAELAIGLMLSLGRHIAAADRSIRDNGFRGWRPAFYGRGIAESTVGIVGFGPPGRLRLHTPGQRSARCADRRTGPSRETLANGRRSGRVGLCGASATAHVRHAPHHRSRGYRCNETRCAAHQSSARLAGRRGGSRRCPRDRTAGRLCSRRLPVRGLGTDGSSHRH